MADKRDALRPRGWVVESVGMRSSVLSQECRNLYATVRMMNQNDRRERPLIGIRTLWKTGRAGSTVPFGIANGAMQFQVAESMNERLMSLRLSERYLKVTAVCNYTTREDARGKADARIVTTS